MAHDMGWEEGLDLLFLHFDAIPRDKIIKSQFQLLQDFERAVETSNNAGVATALQNGLRLDTIDLHGCIGMIIQRSNTSLLNTVFQHHEFSDVMITAICRLCMDENRIQMLDRIHASAPQFPPPPSLIALFVKRSYSDVLEKMILLRKRNSPGTRNSQMTNWIKMAERRYDEQSLMLLKEWDATFARTKSSRNSKGKWTGAESTKQQTDSNGKRKRKAVSETEEEEEESDEDWDEERWEEQLESYANASHSNVQRLSSDGPPRKRMTRNSMKAAGIE